MPEVKPLNALPLVDVSIPPLDDDRLVDTDDVLRMLPISRVSLYMMRRRGDFPPAIRIAPNRIAWRLSSVREWIATRPAVNVNHATVAVDRAGR